MHARLDQPRQQVNRLPTWPSQHRQSSNSSGAAEAPEKEQRAAREADYDVVVTREQGKNGEFTNLLQQEGLAVLEMPLVETTPGADR